MDTTLNFFDLAFAIFALIFVVTAFLRGFVKEIFSLFNWVIAVTLSYLLSPFITDFFSSGSKFLTDVSAKVGIFIFTLLIVVSSTYTLSSTLQKKTPKLVDQSLGVLYGLVKTMLIFGFIYSFVSNFSQLSIGKGGHSYNKPESLPSWVVNARCRGIIKIPAQILDPVTKVLIDGVAKNMKEQKLSPKTLNNKIDEVIKEGADAASEAGSDLRDESKKIDYNKGYNKRDIEKMNRLMEVVQ